MKCENKGWKNWKTSDIFNDNAICMECTGVERRVSMGKVIGVKLGDLTRRVRIDGPFESIKESIKTAFGLRTRRPFWLEDEEGVVQTLSRDMPPGQYSLILDPGTCLVESHLCASRSY